MRQRISASKNPGLKWAIPMSRIVTIIITRGSKSITFLHNNKSKNNHLNITSFFKTSFQEDMHVLSRPDTNVLMEENH